MPTYVNPDKCDGCKALDKPACAYICPNDLMILDMVQGKSFNQEPDQCWECYSCVKVCPQSAIAMRGYSDVMPLGASLTPLRGTDSIMWTTIFLFPPPPSCALAFVLAAVLLAMVVSQMVRLVSLT